MRHPEYDGAEEYEATKAHLKEKVVEGTTPGPWGATYNGHYWDIRAWDDDRPVPRWAPALASVHSWESEATARLIAASPDLIDACKEAAQAIVEMEDMDHVQRMEWFETTGLDLYELLRAAIERTEGDR